LVIYLYHHLPDCKDDTVKDAEALAKKILGLRIFDDESTQQMWKRSVKDVEGEILCGTSWPRTFLTA